MSTNDTITQWLNKQHVWIQEAAHRLLTAGSLDKADILGFLDLVKNPNVASSRPRIYPTICADTTTATDLRLESIGPIFGIDALNPKSPLEFGDGNLSVVYGINGSGKSGYTRIITKACGKPHSVDLKPNVYQGAPPKQECTFKYFISGLKKTAVWLANTAPIEDLKSVDVFDAECGRIYLEKDTDLSYEPPELTLFTNLVKACQQVEAALSAEQGKLISKLPDIPAKYSNSPAGKAYATFSKDGTSANVAELVAWTTADATALEEQRRRLKIADPYLGIPLARFHAIEAALAGVRGPRLLHGFEAAAWVFIELAATVMIRASDWRTPLFCLTAPARETTRNW